MAAYLSLTAFLLILPSHTAVMARKQFADLLADQMVGLLSAGESLSSLCGLIPLPDPCRLPFEVMACPLLETWVFCDNPSSCRSLMRAELRLG